MHEMFQWIEFEARGARDYIADSHNVANVGGIRIQHSEPDGAYDLIFQSKGKYYIGEMSFTSANDAVEAAKKALAESKGR
jgi:hypothetical protein